MKMLNPFETQFFEIDADSQVEPEENEDQKPSETANIGTINYSYKERELKCFQEIQVFSPIGIISEGQKSLDELRTEDYFAVKNNKISNKRLKKLQQIWARNIEEIMKESKIMWNQFCCFSCRQKLGRSWCLAQCINRSNIKYLESFVSSFLHFYCEACWEKQILSLPFVKSKLDLYEQNLSLMNQLALKDQELQDLQLLHDEIKNQTALNNELIKNLKQDIQKMKENLEDLPSGFAVIDSLKDILTVSDQENNSLLISSGLAPESIRLSIRKEIEIVFDNFLEEKIRSLSQFFDKAVLECEDQIKKLEKFQENVMQYSEDLLTNEELKDTLTPTTKKKEKHEANKELWRNLKTRILSLNKALS